MNAVLQTHGAKHIYKVPEGLRELCADISREVLRSQPAELLPFIAEYVDTLLITRENTKVAVKVVNNILLESQAILSILYRAGFTLEQIAVTAPRIQRAFREYLDAVDTRPTHIYEDPTCDERSMISIRDILEATGATRAEAERAATVIQAAFRGHYERMVSREAEGKIQWQRAITNTLDILKKAGATQAEISKAARLVKFAYRGYYTRRNQKIDAPEAEKEPPKKDERILEPVEAVQAVAWMEMMYNDSGLMLEKANEAASIIQRAYKKYRANKHGYDVQQLETTKTMVTEAVLDTVHRKIFEKVISRDDIPEEYGTREEMMAASTKLQLAFKEQMRKTYLIKEGDLETDEDEEDEEDYKEREAKKVVLTEPQPKPKYRPVEPKVLPSETEEPLTEEEMEVTETEITEPLTASPKLESEPEMDRSELVEEIEADEKVRETEEDEEREKEEDERLEETGKKDEKLEEETGTEEEQEEE
ncbi:hypothetical protein QLX08_000688 [Tetragonisca angustula]|uniref:RIIa domain-containing protein n=1 Tax=Tetragonisca angustula TaxID=166442 RepID=A0AAW1AIF4_9HYME